MSIGPYEDILKRAREQLSDAERQKLAEELARQSPDHTDQAGRTLFDALEQRGIIGSIDDAPSDLSTNPSHMEGFGTNDR